MRYIALYAVAGLVGGALLGASVTWAMAGLILGAFVGVGRGWASPPLPPPLPDPEPAFGEYVAELLRPYGGRVEDEAEGVLAVRSPHWTGTIRGADGNVRIELKCPQVRFKRMDVGQPSESAPDAYGLYVEPDESAPPARWIGVSRRWSLMGEYDEAETRRFLDEGTLGQLRNLIALNYQVPFDFTLKGDSVVVVKSCGTKRLRTIVHAVRLSLRLVDRAVATLGRTDGVEIVEVVARGGRCEICGCPLDVDLVACVRCKAAHHGGCWEYAGRCSTYACGGTEAAPVPKA